MNAPAEEPQQPNQNLPDQPNKPNQPPENLDNPPTEMANPQHLNWSYFKPEFTGKPDEDAEAHLLRTNDWMNTHNFPNDQKNGQKQQVNQHLL